MQRYATVLAVTCSLVFSGSDRPLCGAEPPAAGSKAPERHIALDGQPNFRDLGGYRTADGRTVRWRQLFRSGELPRLSDGDVAKLDGLELRSVVNFLTKREIEAHGADRLPEGVAFIPMPMEAGNLGEIAGDLLEARKTGDFTKIPPEINPEIHRFLMREGREYYADFLRKAADPANRPMAFHCSHGIHRTGTAAAILLSALGVPWEVVREDYLLSNELRKEEVEKRVEQLKALDAQNRGIPIDEVDASNIKAFYILRGSYIDAALEAAKEDYGSMDAYIREGLGISDREVERLRSELLEE